MAKLYTVAKARAAKRVRRCIRCGHVVQVGEPYKYIEKGSIRNAVTLTFCGTCQPKRSDYLMGHAQDVAVMEEGFEHDMRDLPSNPREQLEAAKSALDTLADAADDKAEEIRDSANNMEDAFGHSTMQTDNMNETADAFDEWVSNLREQMDNIDTALELEDEPDEGDEDEPDSDAEYLTDEKATEVINEAESVALEVPDLNLTA